MDKLLLEIKNIVRQCGNIIIDANDDLDIKFKEGINNVVTKYDILIQSILKEKLTKLLPQSIFIGEEEDYENKQSEYKFIVDPIDGTTNFTRGFNMSMISVALLKNESPILAVCYNPYIDEMYTAIKGKGAYLNDKKIHVSNKILKEGIVLCGCAPYYEELREKSLDICKKMALVAGCYRRSGSAVMDMCAIAAGKAEVYFELKLMPWDYAAASLIVQEAGGVVTTTYGDKIQYSKPTSILASNNEEDYIKYIIEEEGLYK